VSWGALLTCVTVVACGGRTGLAQGNGGSATDADACTSGILASDPQGATALALDGEAVFWGTPDGLVERRDGSGSAVLATETSSIDAVAVDATRVYYTTTGVLHAVPRGGGPSAVVATQLGQPFALTLDESAGALYLLDSGAGIAAGRVLRVEPGGVVSELLTGLDVPSGLAIDDGSVYVTAHGVLLGGQLTLGPLLRIPKTGGLGVALATGIHQPSSVAVHGDDVYFVEQLDAQSTEHGGLRRVPKAGGDVTPLASTPGVLPLDVFVDASGAYLTTFSGTSSQNQGTLLRIALDGTMTSELAATPGVLYGFVRASAGAVYWTIDWQAGHPAADGASVRKLCK
jgi:hypothetical protein